MSKQEWLKAYLATRQGDITVTIDNSGIAWAGFWIGLGIVVAVAVWKGQVVLK